MDFFSPATLREAWRLAQGRCECQRLAHGHPSRCDALLAWEHRGLVGVGGWQATPWTAFSEGGRDDVGNCEVVCWKCFASRVVVLGQRARKAAG